ncbi:hypothetical protein VB834_09265 [Limnoraphis robusta Tam1]|uniref:DUF1064 domain-containing protein n=2 Tax=Limnoraphis TaxID=1332112 RepID=A0ABU5TYM9_9CYAN|nr:hypothetical protein [Limnoraphis robusta]MEA5500360.1 hypothetical protein [Limnoraphis robusta BA-68 BA1]MEA5519558.1 hypothetical protein [Limnoraphis robusta CCNP1315]MEA5539222.1 hypothetical protein [Limnoraphis robusta Tam1]MEA5545826.1 hypothetical protein [Limnoraphis robusta CCNP1324]
MRMIQARRETYKGIVFDSQFELETMKTLEKYFPLPSIKVHQPIEVRPKSNWFPSQDWKVDFTVCQDKKPVLYVESKGFIQAEFKEKMKNLAYLKPEIFEKLVIVCPVITTVARGFVTYDLRTFNRYLTQCNLDGLVNDCKKSNINGEVE